MPFCDRHLLLSSTHFLSLFVPPYTVLLRRAVYRIHQREPSHLTPVPACTRHSIQGSIPRQTFCNNYRQHYYSRSICSDHTSSTSFCYLLSRHNRDRFHTPFARTAHSLS